jgi:hypothetical protein
MDLRIWDLLWSSGQFLATDPEVPGSISGTTRFFWELVGLERGPLSLVSTIEELLDRNSSGSGLENLEDSCGDLLRWPHDTLYSQKFSLSLPTNGGRSVGVVH